MTTYFYSPETSGFYVKEIHASMPEDVFEIAETEYRELIEGQSAGKKITYKGRRLILEDQPPRTVTWDVIREKRDDLLSSCDWTQMPDTPLSPEVVAEWRAYRQSLRDVTETFPSPDKVEWPTIPGSKE